MAGGITDELAKLKVLRGADFVRQLKAIVVRKEFHPLDTDPNIFIVGGEQDDDYPSLISAARKAVEHGYKVYILPNPHDFRTADFIFERKGVYGIYDLKTIYGKNSVESQLLDSIDQSNRVLLNMIGDYNARILASDIKSYFQTNREAVEVLIFKGKRAISVTRYQVEASMFNRLFRKYYEQ